MFLNQILGNERLVHILWYDILGRYFAMIQYFGTLFWDDTIFWDENLS